ncbi:hypothetical protein GCM10017557_82820 [Streptomyces aurantiacus]|uniref:Uncharacterized protein n=1 Tax=Streptomyces aurantiacus TaxID=47760 RepID=A0A7G1PCS1_9ACTN|nr:hypothetical protein GCM10017557_82820 [Streptomyces aurantiacus]
MSNDDLRPTIDWDESARGITGAVSPSTGRRRLRQDAIKPWEHRSWTSIRDAVRAHGVGAHRHPLFAMCRVLFVRCVRVAGPGGVSAAEASAGARRDGTLTAVVRRRAIGPSVLAGSPG